MPPRGGRESALDTAFSVLSRTGQSVSRLFEAWFGPGDPPPVVAPEGSERRMDYPAAINTRTTPRDTEPVTFGTLRQLADACDILRLAIETRKDQLSRLRWEIRRRKDLSDEDPRIEPIVEFLREPDKEHDWSTWLRALLEDLFVIDAPALYPRRAALRAAQRADQSVLRLLADRADPGDRADRAPPPDVGDPVLHRGQRPRGDCERPRHLDRRHDRQVPGLLGRADRGRHATALAAFWKRHYNSPAGKGTVEKFRKVLELFRPELEEVKS